MELIVTSQCAVEAVKASLEPKNHRMQPLQLPVRLDMYRTTQYSFRPPVSLNDRSHVVFAIPVIGQCFRCLQILRGVDVTLPGHIKVTSQLLLATEKKEKLQLLKIGPVLPPDGMCQLKLQSCRLASCEMHLYAVVMLDRKSVV